MKSSCFCGEMRAENLQSRGRENACLSCFSQGTLAKCVQIKKLANGANACIDAFSKLARIMLLYK